MSNNTRQPYETAGRIRRNLHQIRDYYDPALHAPPPADEGRGSNHAAAGEPVNLHAVDTRQATLRDLNYWTWFILNELPDAQRPSEGPARVDADTLAAFVDTWALMVAETSPDDADNLEKETGKHGRALEALAKGWTSKRIRIPGRCPELRFVVSAQGVEELVPCEGELWSTFREEDNGLLPRFVVCDADGAHTWEPHDWAALGRKVGTFKEGA